MSCWSSTSNTRSLGSAGTTLFAGGDSTTGVGSGAATVGSSRRKVEPAPGPGLSALKTPPWASAIARPIARPRPSPP